MNKVKKLLFGFFKVSAIFGIITLASCSSDDESGSISDEFANFSFITNANTTSFIEADKKVTLSVSGTYEDGGVGSKNRGFVYSTSVNPDATSNNSIDVIGSGNDAVGMIKGLDQNTVYYIRGFIQSDTGEYFYGNEIKTTTAKQGGEKSVTLKIISPIDIGTTIRSTIFSVSIKEMTGEAPVEVGVQYSAQSDFVDFKTIKSESNIVLGGHSIEALFLNPSTKYYFRPYAKYQDDSNLVGKDDTVISITTKDMKVGDYYPLTEDNFSGHTSSNYIVFEIDQVNRTALLVRTKDIISVSGWKTNYAELGLEVRNPTIEEIKKMTTLDAVDSDTVLFLARFENFGSIDLWVSEEESQEKAFTYNPITKEKKAIEKINETIKTRFVGELKF